MYRRSPPGRDAIVNRCAPKRGSHSLRRPADSLPQSRSKSRHTVTQRRFGDINCSDFVCAKPGKTWIEQNTLRARVWQCKCLSPSRYEKQTHTSRPQPFIHSHSNLPLQQCNNFVSTLPQVLGATTKSPAAPGSATVVGSGGAGTERLTLEPKPVCGIFIATVSLRRLGRREKCIGGERHHLRLLLHHGYAGQSQRRTATVLCRMGTNSRNGRHQFRQDDPVAGP